MDSSDSLRASTSVSRIARRSSTLGLIVRVSDF
jgi:hypothetical protein